MDATESAALLAQLQQRFGEDIAQEAFCHMWEQFGRIEAWYAMAHAQGLQKGRYDDGLPSEGLFAEWYTSTGDLSWMRSRMATPEEIVLQDVIDDTAEEKREQVHRVQAQETLLHTPYWLTEIHLEHQRQQALFRDYRKLRRRSRLWPVGIAVQTVQAPHEVLPHQWDRRIPRTLIYLHPYSITPGASHRRCQPRIVPRRMESPGPYPVMKRHIATLPRVWPTKYPSTARRWKRDGLSTARGTGESPDQLPRGLGRVTHRHGTPVA